MKLAIFDIDGTLVRGHSERMFWWYLLRHGKQGPRQIFAYLLFLIRYLPIGGIHTARKNKAYLTGLRARDVEQLAHDFVAKRLMNVLYEPAVQRLKEHLARGEMVVLISGTLDCLACALAKQLGVKRVCATLCSQRNGIFLAQPPELHPFGAAKLSLVRQLAHELEIGLDEVGVYADSRHDVLLLEAVGTPVAVQPDGALRRVAEKLEWQVIGERVRTDAAVGVSSVLGWRRRKTVDSCK
jgi:HAD superfamily hydrolase (TIGR01490 family)